MLGHPDVALLALGAMRGKRLWTFVGSVLGDLFLAGLAWWVPRHDRRRRRHWRGRIRRH